MNILIVGGGGREHAIAAKVASSKLASTVFVAPGNAGTTVNPSSGCADTTVQNVAIPATDVDALLAFAKDQQVGLTIVGPEQPLVLGITDRFNAAGLSCFGPCEAAAILEGSKSFAKAFLDRHGIPTARYQSFTDVEAALAYLSCETLPIVIKADGLAAGKGVVIAESAGQASDAIRDMLSGNRFGEAGHKVVIEEFMQGEEASFICIVSGETVLPMASSQDHKAAYDADQGPNTGGMGAYSPAPVVDDKMTDVIMQRVIYPTVRGLKAEGIPYVGFLYAGLMIGTDQIPRVVEFNCRFGDPEAQPVLGRLQSDLLSHCLAAVNGSLDKEVAKWDPRPCLGVVMAAEGYPEGYEKGAVISGLEQSIEDTSVYHAGTANSGNEVVTSGGRVLCVTGFGETISAAQRLAYARVAEIDWQGAWYRHDIGYRAVERES